MRNFLLSLSFIISVQVCIFPLNMCDIIIYVVGWWEKYFSKRSLVKHTCSWRDKLMVLWTVNRQANIFLQMICNSQNCHNFFMSIWLEKCHVAFLYLTHRKIRTRISIKTFLLWFAWNWHLFQNIYNAKNASTFQFFSRGAVLL